jgi:hypothetical protein
MRLWSAELRGVYVYSLPTCAGWGLRRTHRRSLSAGSGTPARISSILHTRENLMLTAVLWLAGVLSLLAFLVQKYEY